MKKACRRNPEAGYALLFVYAMAASVAIMLYMELPRVAFEAQRDKEQLLIDRGEQYERGIQLYFRKFHQYPPTLDALDNTQNIRFLRRRYPDPMTGKDWRLIHVGAGGVLTDSLMNKGKSLAPAPAQKQNFVNELALVGATNTPDTNQPVNLAARRRASDTPGGPGSPGGPPVDPNNPNAANNPNAPVDPNSAFNTATAGAIPGQQIQGANGASIVLPDGRVVPAVNGLPGGTGQMPAGQAATAFQGNVPVGLPTQQNPYAQSSMPGQPGAPSQGAVNLINQLLTSPHQGGLNGGVPGQTSSLNSTFFNQPGAGQTGTSPQAGTTPFGSTTATSNTGTPITGTTGQTIGAGIAGIATKADGEGIKVYNDSSKYKEWEFIYDLSKDTSMTGGQQVAQGQQSQQQNGLNGSSSNPLGNSSQQSPFGSQTQSGFGGQTPAPPQAPASSPQQ